LRRPWGYRLILLGALIIGLGGGCETTPLPHAPRGDYYLTSNMSYMWDAAVYDSHVVAQLYKGDQVERLEVIKDGWWRVRSGRTGQLGWVPGELYSAVRPPVPEFYVIQTIPLRECPKDLCPSLQLLSRGDRVQKLEQNTQGWWRVLVAKTRNIGWLPANTVVESLEESQAQGLAALPYLYVAVKRLKLLGQPLINAEVIKVLQFNDQVEKLDQTPEGWLKIRQSASGAEGWVPARDLEDAPARYPRPEKPRKTRHQPLNPNETTPEPEIM
jgi:uncharacterized protein YgiM (DUF1202 family)